MVGSAMLCAFVPLAMAQSDLKTPSASDQYVPRLGDIMSAAQARHMKLWLAGKAHNWDLAAFELRLLKESLVEAALLYSGIPVTNVTTLEAPLQAASDAISAKDGRKFAKAVGEVTDGCNSCHQSMARGFIVMRVPTDQQPFGNQLFPPQGKR
jgi:hypothetical protein